jgi:transcriptional regulator with XRE-family HTH domain
MAESPRPLPSLDDALRDTMAVERADCLLGPESPEGRELARMVGANVARERERRGLDRAAVALRVGLSEEQLALVETGRAVPSLRGVWALATALGVPFGALLALQGAGADTSGFRVQRAGRGRVISSSSGRFRSRALFTPGDPGSPEVYELTLAPGCVEDAEPHAPDTFEHITVIRGTLVVRAGTSRAELSPGDAILFRADVPHGYENPGDGDVVAQLVMTYA